MITEAISNNILNAFFVKGSNSAIPTSGTCYIGLSTTTPTMGTDGVISNFTEPEAATGYKRVRLGISNQPATLVMDSADGGKIKNHTNFIFFDEATAGGGGYGTITHFGLFVEDADGAPVLTGALTTATAVAEGHVLIFRPDDLQVTMS